MLNLKFICENIDLVKNALKNRNGQYPIDEIVQLNEERKTIIHKVELLKAKRNEASSQIAILKREGKPADKAIMDTKTLGDNIKSMDDRLNEINLKLNDYLLNIPNIPHDSVPIGTTDQDNLEVRKYGTPTDRPTLPHWDIGEKLGILNFREAAKITGARFTVYRGLGAKLERAIVNLMLDTHSSSGYQEIFPPFVVNRDSMYGTGQLPKFEEDMFALKGTDYYLVPTAEVPVTNLHRDDILDMDTLPIKYCAYTACFRAEAGSAGRDTRGLIRQHQFNKVELVKFAHPNNSYDELESLTNNAEKILQSLDLPYRVVNLCSGDLGFSSAKTYDIEVWMPSYGRYVEISSCSNFEDFQARRANIRYRDSNGKLMFVHTLNGSGLAVGRTVAAILENYYDIDKGVVKVPQVLRKYLGTDFIQ